MKIFPSEMPNYQTIPESDAACADFVQKAVAAAMRGNAISLQGPLRDIVTTRWIPQGYRLGELVRVERQTMRYPFMELQVYPSKSVRPFVLWLRRQWRRVRPYRIPNAPEARA
jgi:hypothetical protein